MNRNTYSTNYRSPYQNAPLQQQGTYVQVIRGPQGPQGPPGPPGNSYYSEGSRMDERGTPGPQGATGSQGSIGPRGSTGTFGLTGECWGNYIYWNDKLSQWKVGSSNVSIGCLAGQNNQGSFAIAIGKDTGLTGQGMNAVAIGRSSGRDKQGKNSVAIGAYSGSTSQFDNSIILNATGIPLNSGTTGFFVSPIRELSSNYLLAYNINTNEITYTLSSLISNNQYSSNNQQITTVAIGNLSGFTGQEEGAIAIGTQAGENNQSYVGIAIGTNSGNISQDNYAISIGFEAGYENQGIGSIGIGDSAAHTFQSDFAIAIGVGAGNFEQQSNTVAIGFNAGNMNQGEYSIAIGSDSGSTDQPPNSIIINATGDFLDADTSGCFIAPIRETTGPQSLYYNPETSEISYAPKTFIIDHPNDTNKYLVHACLEGPEAGVYYRGTGEIVPGVKSTLIRLPDYVTSFSKNFTIQITRIIDFEDDDKSQEDEEDYSTLKVSTIKNNSFKVFGRPGKFYWHVYGTRNEIVSEPNKKDVVLKGEGPYKWI